MGAHKKRYNSPNTMTVAQLIRALQDMPQDLPVLTEGCDCMGDAASVEVRTEPDGTKYVEIRR